MKRPWQIWLLYAIGLLGVIGAFAWLTVRAVELDRAEMIARRQAELEEDVTAALWRMDSVLTPLLAEEAARPEYAYQPAYRVAGAVERELSPLLQTRPEFVLLHFQVNPSGQITSPQCPAGDDRELAIRQGISESSINAAAARLSELSPAIAYPVLLLNCSPETLPSRKMAALPTDANSVPPASSNSLANPIENFAQQQVRNQLSPGAQSGNMPANPSGGPLPQQPPEEPKEAAGSPASENSSQQQAQSFANNSIESGRFSRGQTRAGSDLAKRDAALQSYAQKAFLDQRTSEVSLPLATRVTLGVSRPLWMNDHLLVARRVQVGSETVIQGCWLDWPRLEERLKAEVADLLPGVEMTPIVGNESIKLSRLLAALPVQLVVPSPPVPPAGWTPIRVALLVVWACLLGTAAAAAVMLHSVVTLSERRGAFVSAVTHELRTPLTTFRMYAEMLAAGMVPDAADRQRYLETLRIEADRLAHLVENVLQYARLERGRPGKRREQVSLADLIDRCLSRLGDRATQAEMKLDVQIVDADRGVTLATDAAAVEQILFNLVDNSCKYASQSADRRIHISLAADARQVRLIVRDHGPGISSAGRKKLFQPFSKSVHEAASTAPGVGLGLALCRRLAAELGGRLVLQSPAEGGAAFVLSLPR